MGSGHSVVGQWRLVASFVHDNGRGGTENEWVELRIVSKFHQMQEFEPCARIVANETSRVTFYAYVDNFDCLFIYGVLCCTVF